MEDTATSVNRDLAASTPHLSSRGSNKRNTCFPYLKSGTEGTPRWLSSSSHPPRSGNNHTSSIFGQNCAGAEVVGCCCDSSAAADHSSGEPRTHHRFLAEPLHATSAPAASSGKQPCASKSMDREADYSSQSGVPVEAAFSNPCSSRETDTDTEAGNPLLPHRSRRGITRGKSGSGRRSQSKRQENLHTSSGNATKRDIASTEKHEGGEISSNIVETKPPGAAESASAAGEIPRSPTDNGDTPGRLDELSLLSFNAGLLEYKLCGIRVYQNPPFTQRRLHHIPAALLATGADIICLQEVYGEAHADFIIESTRHKLPFVGRRTSGGRFSLHNGLMVLSKYPIIHTHFHKFEDVTYIERCFASKGMLEVAVDVPSIGVIAVFNIHLASGAVDPESRYVEDVRAAEIRQLLKACDSAADRGLVPIVIGDLNAAPHLCASNYKCFVERGWRDCWLHVHGHQRHLLQHHLLHQQQLLEEQQLDDQGIELHDRHIRRDLFVRIRRQRRMQLHNGVEPVAAEELPNVPPSDGAEPSSAEQLRLSRRSLVPVDAPCALTSDADSIDVEGEQKKQLLGQRKRVETRASRRSTVSVGEYTTRSASTQRRGSSSQQPDSHNLDHTMACSNITGDRSGSDSRQSVAIRGSIELTTESCKSTGPETAPRMSRGRSNRAFEAPVDDEKSRHAPMSGLLGGYFGRAGGGMQLPFAFELPAAAAWAHREFFLTAKRRLIEQQQKWLGGGDKAPVLDLRLSLGAPQHRQQGVDATPLASDCSLASCSTALTAARCTDTAVAPAAPWRFGGSSRAPTQNRWHDDGADGSVADWLLSDTDEETESSEGHDVIIQCGSDAGGAATSPCSRRHFTWDPENPLNSIGPHAGCHGLRCDYVFLPPHHFAGGLYPFLPVAADILMRDPRVLVDACCFGCFGEVMLVTLSDHYAVRITLRRSTDADIADFWGSCAAEAAALRPAAASQGTEREVTTEAGTLENK